MVGGDAVAHLARQHARHGTTSLLATTMTAPRAEIEAALRAAAPYVTRPVEGGARVLGVHLEGPYISPGRLGAQPDFAAVATVDDVMALHALAPIRFTIAPEQRSPELIVALRDRGFVVQIGHRPAARTALRRWPAPPLHHLFNAMTVAAKEPGMAGAALAHGRSAEIIGLAARSPRRHHVALRCIPALL
jgi:N-acetylglucosamine-6-phosphate deacetylase